MPCLRHSSASSLSRSFLYGVRVDDVPVVTSSSRTCEAVVVLAGDGDVLHAGGLGERDPLVGVELVGVELGAAASRSRRRASCGCSSPTRRRRARCRRPSGRTGRTSRPGTSVAPRGSRARARSTSCARNGNDDDSNAASVNATQRCLMEWVKHVQIDPKRVRQAPRSGG